MIKGRPGGRSEQLMMIPDMKYRDIDDIVDIHRLTCSGFFCCFILNGHIEPRRSAPFIARFILREVREGM